MYFYYDLDLTETTKDEIVLEINQKYKIPFAEKRVIKRVEKLKREYARYIYEEANFNFPILEYAIKEYYKKFRKLRDKLETL
mmetsp:Transcript_8395/g.1121  ORF Transcript_8395/g.1121 Transcript_8395/m.1121 type:complete len:82 (+) Transcript_8395:323-568(+)